jgi:two-component system cell cycle sensor histidine kinase/response regulator CckA
VTLSSNTVLVVDDEELVRSLVRRLLEAESCTVLEAEDGERALAIVERRNPPVNLVLTDLVMPRISGLEVVGAVRASRPELPVLVMSGFGSSDETRRALEGYGVAVVPKPFSPVALVDAVRDALLEAAERAPGNAHLKT